MWQMEINEINYSVYELVSEVKSGAYGFYDVKHHTERCHGNFVISYLTIIRRRRG